MAMPAPSDQTTALITGASSGIGAELAKQLAARGHHLTLVARRRDRLAALATSLRDEHGVGVDVFACDLADPDARDGLIQHLAGGERRVAVLVNNAGLATGGRFTTVAVERELQQVRVLVEAVVHLTSAVLPQMVQARSGAILNVASTAGFQPMPWSAGYAAAKAHTLAFSEALHHEVSGRGVTVTALCPGPVQTEFWEAAGDQPIEKAMPRFVWVAPHDVAAAGLRGLERGRRVVVPGTVVRTMSLGRLAPRSIQLPILTRVMRPAHRDS